MRGWVFVFGWLFAMVGAALLGGVGGWALAFGIGLCVMALED